MEIAYKGVNIKPEFLHYILENNGLVLVEAPNAYNIPLDVAYLQMKDMIQQYSELDVEYWQMCGEIALAEAEEDFSDFDDLYDSLYYNPENKDLRDAMLFDLWHSKVLELLKQLPIADKILFGFKNGYFGIHLKP